MSKTKNVTETLRNKIIRGIGWNSLQQAVQICFQFSIGVLLARLLGPTAFGLIGMVTVFTGFATIFSDLGFGAALIQKKHLDERHYSTVFWLNVLTGLALTTILFSSSYYIGSFYAEPLLIPLTKFISLNFFISSFAIIHLVSLEKKLNFKKITIIKITALVISGFMALILAVNGFGVWSLAVQSVVSTTVITFLLWYSSSWKPLFIFDWYAVKDLLGFSSNKLGFTIFNYWARNSDNMLIGRFLDATSLGIYSRSYSLMLLPLTNISQVISRVMFPAFSQIQEEKQRVSNIYLRMTTFVGLFTFPLMLGLFVLSENFVLAVFGTKWIGMIPILRVFCLVGLLQSIGSLNGNLYLSQGRADLQLKVGLIIGSIGILSIIIGLQWGVMGVAYSYATFSILLWYPSIRIAISLVNLKFFEVYRNLIRIFMAALTMALIIWLVSNHLPESWAHMRQLLVLVPLGVLVYFININLFKIKAYREIKGLIAENWNLSFIKKT